MWKGECSKRLQIMVARWRDKVTLECYYNSSNVVGAMSFRTKQIIQLTQNKLEGM